MHILSKTSRSIDERRFAGKQNSHKGKKRHKQTSSKYESLSGEIKANVRKHDLYLDNVVGDVRPEFFLLDDLRTLLL